MLKLLFSFLFLLCSVNVARAAESDLPTGVWYYRMHGDLDEYHLRCEGFAQINDVKSGDGKHCINWTMIKKICKGDKEVDWLHADGTSGEVCEKGDDWVLTKKLPSLGTCEPHVMREDDKSTMISLFCNWKCTDEEGKCEGTAFYRFAAP